MTLCMKYTPSSLREGGRIQLQCPTQWTQVRGSHRIGTDMELIYYLKLTIPSCTYCACALVFVSVCLSVCLSACQTVKLSACLRACLSACLPASLPPCLPACLSVCLSVCDSAVCVNDVCRFKTKDYLHILGMPGHIQSMEHQSIHIE